MKILSEAAPITEFKIGLFNAFVEMMMVIDGKRVIVTLLDGTELECEIE